MPQKSPCGDATTANTDDFITPAPKIPDEPIIVSSILVSTILGSLVISSWGMISAAHVKSVADIQPGSKSNPSVDFDRVAILWGYFGGMGIGICVAFLRLSKGIWRYTSLTVAILLALVTIITVYGDFARIEHHYLQ